MTNEKNIEVKEYNPTQEELNLEFSIEIDNLKQKTDRIFLYGVIVCVIIFGLMFGLGMLK